MILLEQYWTIVQFYYSPIVLLMNTKTPTSVAVCQKQFSTSVLFDGHLATSVSFSFWISHNLSHFPSYSRLLSSLLVPPPLWDVSVLWSPPSEFRALISTDTCITSRCVQPAEVLGPVGWGLGSLWLTAVISREWQTSLALSPRSMTLPLFPPQAAVTGWPIRGLQV